MSSIRNPWAGLAEQTATETGAQNNYSLNAPHTFLRCTGTAPVFSGFTIGGAAPWAGCMVLISCQGTTAKVDNQGAGSTAAHRIITPSSNGQILGLNGMTLLQYDATTARWRETLLDAGAAISVAHSAGNFTGTGSMTWTVDAGDHTQFRYIQRGKHLRVTLSIDTSSVGGTPSTFLTVAIPGGFTTNELSVGILSFFDNNVSVAALAYCVSGATTMRLQRADNANMSASTNLTYVIMFFEFEVQ